MINTDACSEVGSPSYSLHTRNTNEINMFCNVDPNKEVSGEFCNDNSMLQLDKNGSVEVVSMDKENLDDYYPPNSLYL